MIIEDLMLKQNYTKYRLAVQAGIPHATLSDICSGKTKIEKCSAETVYKLAKALDVSMEALTVDGINQACNAALMRIVPRIDIEKIEKVINAIPCITDLQQKFYKYYIRKRYELIIMPTYESIMAGK